MTLPGLCRRRYVVALGGSDFVGKRCTFCRLVFVPRFLTLLVKLELFRKKLGNRGDSRT